ncbi:biotin--[acetyl-CoA-carboxylase] ligase [Ferviditalea candida]|uniref:Bifunctional ligase/repressor BirA n=1 Tax=Ferviditalea candida TaxID=3108399 RepID=A0ABU5ZHG0_9BACL|nr:biotin--[acetyl-CoA-carboxylase] ligase [Paenibacillaceae bacterium T2]
MNERILQILLDHQDQFISGEQLSSRLNCSRTAIWKHIRHLRKQGYEFEAVPRLGYRLVKVPDKLDEEQLAKLLKTEVMGRRVHMYETVESTQTAAREWFSKGEGEGTLILAEQQTAGRGRLGRKWHSPAGKGLWMSLILTPRISLHFAPQLTLLTAVALCRTIHRMSGVPIGIKWPNDLLINGKKVSGILLESHAEDDRLQVVVAGVGISVNMGETDFPEELKDIATSLLLETGKTANREELLAEFLYEFEQLYQLYHERGFAPIRALWEALSISIGRLIRIQTHNGWVSGKAEAVDEMGALVIVQEDGSKTKLYAGDISVI